MIRSRKLAVVLSLIFVLVLVPFSVGLSIKNIYPSAEAPAIWQRPASDRPMVIGFIIVLLVFFGLLPISFFLMRLRRRLRPWVFDRASGQLTHGNRSWPLADATAVAVDITTQKATVILRVGDDQAVEIVRFIRVPKVPAWQAASLSPKRSQTPSALSSIFRFRSEEPSAAMTKRQTQFSLIWVGSLLTLAVGAFLAFFSYSVINECRAMSFASTQGVVDSMSQGMTPYSRHGGGGFFIDVAYHYSVADRQYRRQRLTYVEISSES